MRHRCFFFFFFLHRLHSGYFFQYIDFHDLTRLGSLYQSCFSESAGTGFADCVENCTHINSLVSNLLRCLLSIETEIVETGTRFYGIRHYTQLGRKVVKEKKTDKTQRRLEDAMPSQRVSIPCYIVRPAIIRIQDALGIKVKVTSVFLQTGLRIKHREESLSLTLCPCLDMFVMLMMIQTHLGHLGIGIARACIEQ